ncbi:hypothetical protein GCM10010112_85400 [Actinoplanes lobatus]|uniref:Uncharacterized protein n=1 Tax=Actinoplanes lobatus TaxID=113568 RepID=A0ABQ4AYF3_9ACTN|nr:hypothetical protein GCM10010112_85400 [Actinoplanes lobatus]GIE45840.1 hypothetical protein Alo02nite_87380 [Actinoplanes lobatus]
MVRSVHLPRHVDGTDPVVDRDAAVEIGVEELRDHPDVVGGDGHYPNTQNGIPFKFAIAPTVPRRKAATSTLADSRQTGGGPAMIRYGARRPAREHFIRSTLDGTR